jgi:hypothetical protein
LSAYILRDVAIPDAGGPSSYEGDVFIAQDAPDSGVQVSAQLTILPDGGYRNTGASEARGDYVPFQMKLPPSGPSAALARIQVGIQSTVNGKRCVRVDRAYVLRYPQ